MSEVSQENLNDELIKEMMSDEPNITRVADLINSGADINKATYSWIPALVVATGLGKKEVVKLFLKNGANVNIRAEELLGMTPLIATIYGTYCPPRDEKKVKVAIEIMKMLIENGADANLKDKSGRTARDWAYRSPKMVKILSKAEKTRNGRGGK